MEEDAALCCLPGMWRCRCKSGAGSFVKRCLPVLRNLLASGSCLSASGELLVSSVATSLNGQAKRFSRRKMIM